MGKVTDKKSAKKSSKVAAKTESSSSSSSSSESSSSSSDSSSSSSSESESEEEKKEESTSSSSDSESSSDSSSSDSDSSSSSDEEEEKEEEKEEKKESSSSESSSSSSSESESESEESEESDSKKRKASDSEESNESEESDSKKAKTQTPATIFVGRLSWSIDDEWLKNEFEPIGGVVSARVMYERGTDRSRGYGYVDFEDISFAEKAIEEMQGKEIDGRPINVDMSTSKPANPNAERSKRFGDVPSEPSDTLFLGNLSFGVERDNLYELFGKYGEIISVRIPTHPETEQPKGFGYVQYSNIDDAKKALEGLQGEQIDNRPVRLDYSTPRPQNDDRRGGRGGRGGSRGGFRGGRGGFGGNRDGGFRGRQTGSNNSPLGKPRNSASFSGTKKTFD